MAAQNGDTVTVHYTGTLKDGTVFDTSKTREPLQFEIGGGKIIPAFEEAVIGMSPGESKSKTIPADQAYGPYRKELITKVDRQQMPPDLDPQVGQQLQTKHANGEQVVVTVLDVNETQVTVDANHPLAGEDLSFEIELVDVLANS